MTKARVAILEEQELRGCFLLSGPSTVNGTVGGSLSVQCQYEEEDKAHDKYWCRKSFLLCDNVVKTEGSRREVRRSRVTIRDHPANLSFTVTLERLTLQDAGSYICGVDAPWQQDPTFKVTVSVLPAPKSEKPTSVTIARTSTATTKIPTTSCTGHGGITHTSNSQENQQDVQDSRLPVLLSLLGVLLLLLLGLSLLVWRILQKRVKGGEHSGLGQNPKQAIEQCEPHYANVQLHTWSLQEEPALPSQVEYSTVAFPGEDLHYSSVVFDSQKQDSNANGVSSQRPQEEEPEYSVVKKPENHLLSPCPP
ncbi:CMRF35-like molecule 8 [Erethizon dorsatum]